MYSGEKNLFQTIRKTVYSFKVHFEFIKSACEHIAIYHVRFRILNTTTSILQLIPSEGIILCTPLQRRSLKHS